MGVTGTGNFSALLAPGLRNIFNLTLKSIPPEFTMLYNMDKSKRNYEEDHNVGGFGPMGEKNQGEPIQYDDPVDGTTIRYTHKSFGKGFRVTREMNDDDLYGVIMKYPKALAKCAAFTKEVRGWRLLNSGFVTTYNTGFDGLALFSAAHTLLKGGTNSNILSTDVDLSVTSIQSMLTLFQNITDDSGFPLGGLYNPSTLIVPPSLEFLATQLVGSQYEPFTPDNQINVPKVRGLKVFVSHYLNVGTSGNGWFLKCPEVDSNWFTRVPIEFDNADDFDTKDAKYTAYERYSQGFGDWRGWAGSQGS